MLETKAQEVVEEVEEAQNEEEEVAIEEEEMEEDEEEEEAKEEEEKCEVCVDVAVEAGPMSQRYSGLISNRSTLGVNYLH